jgi:6-phosphogluconolactonase
MSVTPEIHIAGNLHEWAQDAAAFIFSISEQAIKPHGRFIIALSGGSTPKTVYQVLATTDWKVRLDWSRTFFLFGDERCIPPDHRRAISRWPTPRCFNRSTFNQIMFVE